MGSSDSSESGLVSTLGGTVIFLACVIGAIGLLTWVINLTLLAAAYLVQATAQLQLSPAAQAMLVFSAFTVAPISLAAAYTYVIEPKLESMRIRRVARAVVGVGVVAFLFQWRSIEDLLPAASAAVHRMLVEWSIRAGVGILIAWGVYRLVRWMILDERAARARAVRHDPPL